MIAHASAVRSGANALLQNKPRSVRVKIDIAVGVTVYVNYRCTLRRVKLARAFCRIGTSTRVVQ
jgi:hypothetical protein